MATACVGYLPAQNQVVTLPEHALRPPGVAYLAGETLQPPIVIARNLPAENVLRSDIEQLCNATLTIDKAFCDIGQKLSHATKEQKKRAELYKICYDLENRWKQHHKTYKQLLWRSREVAGEARFVVDDFREVFLPCLRDPATTPLQRQQLAQEHIKKLEDKAKTSEDLSQKFLDFVEVLDGYMADFSRAVERFRCPEQSEKCNILENKLGSAKAAMDK
ncbi:hypothetical protein PAXRUDRAFT_435042 [Paxillus rubicundulus Ve08.2h10]|uniref:Uncharacterized protein n=1 Tax=Paxillus rubicundulus Ve08.2h10 TaxID=930991 RepID=A0A0D0DBT6_9AGAM|nr:hypothetical protein PAXRUDRAFT_435042 [Paxillus rubicundulus Ve08.2h10]